jgi:hypothetical protein
MVVVLIRSNHIGGAKVSVHAASANIRSVYTNLYTTNVVTSNQYNYHQHSQSTALAACTLNFTPPMWFGGVKVNIHATSVVDSGC